MSISWSRSRHLQRRAAQFVSEPKGGAFAWHGHVDKPKPAWSAKRVGPPRSEQARKLPWRGKPSKKKPTMPKLDLPE